MLRRILADPALVAMLCQVDRDLAEQARRAGCRFCGEVLHSARYPRKPRAPFAVPADSCWRLSLCCAAEGCRRRTTPCSVLFLGRRVYLGVVVVLVTAMVSGISGRRLRELRRELEVDRRTLERWRTWWREFFPGTRFWQEQRARFMPPPQESAFPASLVARFAATRDGVRDLLRWLSPLSVPDGA